MNEILQASLTGPTLPATVLMGVAAIYWLTVIAGLLDLDALDLDLDWDVDGDSVLGLGFVPLRFLNLGSVPLMIWISVFALAMWISSMCLDHLVGGHDWSKENNWAVATAILRSGAIGLVAAKILTTPLRGKFDVVETADAASLLGQECEITSFEATGKSGQAKATRDGIPLLLNVRSNEGTLRKGQRAEIIEHLKETNIYTVRGVTEEV
jgi:hypothetical protein